MLCPTSISFPINFKNFGSTIFILGASDTISFVIPVRSSTSSGILFFGLTNCSNVSTISEFSTSTAPNSVIKSYCGFSPVVSRSITTYLFGMLEIFRLCSAIEWTSLAGTFSLSEKFSDVSILMVFLFVSVCF